MLVTRHADTQPTTVTAIEGTPVQAGSLLMRPMMFGETMTMLELRYAAGTVAPTHVHAHESVIYVVSGRLRSVVGNETVEVGPGDACRHPANVAHSVEALEDTVMVEVKSPAPDPRDFFRFGEAD